MFARTRKNSAASFEGRYSQGDEVDVTVYRSRAGAA
jgi:hypothetical protein